MNIKMRKPEFKKINIKFNKKKIAIGAAVGVQALLVAGLCIVLIQNGKMMNTLNEYVGANTSIHEIYDDTAVVDAYKSGNTTGLSEEDKFVVSKAREIIKENIKGNMTDYQKELAIYNWQVKYVTFNDDSLAPISSGDDDSDTPYGVLKNHSAICVGNATTFKLFMDVLGIDCKIIHSTANGEHAWDLVKLDDEWYHVDVTFDGGTGDKPGYNYFNVPDSVKDNGDYPWDNNEIPAANGIKYCYVYNNAITIKDLYDLPKEIKKAIESGKTSLNVVMTDRTGFNQDVSDYITGAFTTDTEVINYSNAYSIGDKIIYNFTISYDYGDNDSTQSLAKIETKLQEIIGNLNQ